MKTSDENDNSSTQSAKTNEVYGNYDINFHNPVSYHFEYYSGHSITKEFHNQYRADAYIEENLPFIIEYNKVEQLLG